MYVCIYIYVYTNLVCMYVCIIVYIPQIPTETHTWRLVTFRTGCWCPRGHHVLSHAAPGDDPPVSCLVMLARCSTVGRDVPSARAPDCGK